MLTSLRIAAALTVLLAASPGAKKSKSAPAPVPPAASAEAIQAELNSAFIRRDESTAPLVAVWVAPAMIDHSLAATAKSPRNGAIGERFLSRVLVFALQKPDGVTESDLREHARLRDASGALVSPVVLPQAFQEQFGGGKDAVAVAFPAPAPQDQPNPQGTVELVLQDIGGVPERTYRWTRSPHFSAPVAKTLAAEHARRVAQIRAVAIKPADLMEATTAWLSDFLYVDGHWYIISWLPRELLMAGVGQSSAGKAGATAVAQSLKGATPVAVSAMDPEVKREDLERFSARLRLVDAAGNQYPDTPTKDELLTTLGNTISGNDQLTMRLLVFPVSTDLTGATGPRIIVLDDQRKEVASIAWKRPRALPNALSRYLTPVAPANRPPK